MYPNQPTYLIICLIAIIIIIIKPISSRDSKISPELRTYSKSNVDESKSVRNPSPSNSNLKIDSANSLNRILLKDDSDDVESILDGDEERQNVEKHNEKHKVEKSNSAESAEKVQLISTSTLNSINVDRNDSSSILLDNQTNYLADPFDHQTNVTDSVNDAKLTNHTVKLVDDVFNGTSRSIDVNSVTFSSSKVNKEISSTTSYPNIFDDENDHSIDHNEYAKRKPVRNKTTTPNLKTTTSLPSLLKFDHKSCYTLKELKSMDCSSCLRCMTTLSGNKSIDFNQYKIFLTFSNETFNIFDFLAYETRFRNDFELKFKKELNSTSAMTIIYEDTFPIVNLNQTIFSFLLANKTFKNSFVTENDLVNNLVNGTQIRELLVSNKTELETTFRMAVTCIDTGEMKFCSYPVARFKIFPIYILLESLIGLVLLTIAILLIILCTNRSKSKRQSTKLKPFSELDNNLEYNFYDLNDRNNIGSNSIRLQYLNRISESDHHALFHPYHHLANGSNGFDLANESDIIREEHLHDQLIKQQYQCDGSTIGKSINNKNSNEKQLFYNPKYERKSCFHGVGDQFVCSHHLSQHHHHDALNNNNSKQSNLVSNLANHLSNGNLSSEAYQQDYLERNGTQHEHSNDHESDAIDCDLKFINCGCNKNRNEENTLNKELNNKPPTGKTSFNKARPNHDIADTKL